MHITYVNACRSPAVEHQHWHDKQWTRSRRDAEEFLHLNLATRLEARLLEIALDAEAIVNLPKCLQPWRGHSAVTPASWSALLTPTPASSFPTSRYASPASQASTSDKTEAVKENGTSATTPTSPAPLLRLPSHLQLSQGSVLGKRRRASSLSGAARARRPRAEEEPEPRTRKKAGQGRGDIVPIALGLLMDYMWSSLSSWAAAQMSQQHQDTGGDTRAATVLPIPPSLYSQPAWWRTEGPLKPGSRVIAWGSHGCRPPGAGIRRERGVDQGTARGTSSAPESGMELSPAGWSTARWHERARTAIGVIQAYVSTSNASTHNAQTTRLLALHVAGPEPPPPPPPRVRSAVAVDMSRTVSAPRNYAGRAQLTLDKRHEQAC